jgi:hypothetical protein
VGFLIAQGKGTDWGLQREKKMGNFVYKPIIPLYDRLNIFSLICMRIYVRVAIESETDALRLSATNK